MSLPSVKDYSLLEKIGAGSYATVYKAFKKVLSKIQPKKQFIYRIYILFYFNFFVSRMEIAKSLLSNASTHLSYLKQRKIT